MIIRYENSKGESIDLMEHGIRIYKANFHSYEWEPQGYERRFGVRLDDITKKPLELEMDIAFRGPNKKSDLNRFYAIAEYDVVNCKTGKLYWGDYYLNCMFTSSSTEPSEDFIGAVRTVGVYAPYPFWIREVKKHFFSKDAEPTVGFDSDYPYGYDYDYALSDGRQATIDNDEVSPSEFKITINGPVTYPSIRIGENVYELNVEVESGGYLVIDSALKIAEVTNRVGQKTNAFPYRNLDYYLFEKIASGYNEISCNGGYEWELIIYQTRSEPRWT